VPSQCGDPPLAAVALDGGDAAFPGPSHARITRSLPQLPDDVSGSAEADRKQLVRVSLGQLPASDDPNFVPAFLARPRDKLGTKDDRLGRPTKEKPRSCGAFMRYRYGDSNPGFRTEKRRMSD